MVTVDSVFLQWSSRRRHATRAPSLSLLPFMCHGHARAGRHPCANAGRSGGFLAFAALCPGVGDGVCQRSCAWCCCSCGCDARLWTRPKSMSPLQPQTSSLSEHANHTSFLGSSCEFVRAERMSCSARLLSCCCVIGSVLFGTMCCVRRSCLPTYRSCLPAMLMLDYQPDTRYRMSGW